MMEMMKEAILRAAADRAELVEKVWQDLHRIPEVGYEEHETTRYIADFLAERSIRFEPWESRTGGVALVGQGPCTVLLRADIDGLPVQELTGLEFASENEGKMHACGHDVHTAVLLAVADALAAGAVEFEGTAVLLFQPAEEGPGGCRDMIEAGLLERYPVRRAMALHVWPGMAAGHVGIAEGFVMAGMDYVKLVFKGRGGHGAHPEGCVDSIAAAAQFITTLPVVLSRKVDPYSPSLVTFGKINGGTARNVIPEAVTVEGTIRWVDQYTRERLWALVESMAVSTASEHGGECEVTIGRGYIPTYNERTATGELGPALAEVLGEESVQLALRSMGSEDMSFLLEKVPGCYIQLGAGDEGSGANPLHSGLFVPDVRCLATGVAAMLTGAWRFGRLP